jgi:hypothetical protein
VYGLGWLKKTFRNCLAVSSSKVNLMNLLQLIFENENDKEFVRRRQAT